MFDLSWSELLLVGAVALVVIGPRELPRVLRTVGQTLAKVRRMAGDFQSQFSAAMKEAELDELRNAVNDVQSTAGRVIGSAPGKAFDPLRTVRDELRSAIETPAAAPSGTTTATPADEAPLPSFAAPPPAAEPVIDAGDSGDGQGGRRFARRRHRVIVAAPREVVKPLAQPTRQAPRLYRKVRFSALPPRPRPERGGEGKA